MYKIHKKKIKHQKLKNVLLKKNLYKFKKSENPFWQRKKTILLNNTEQAKNCLVFILDSRRINQLKQCRIRLQNKNGGTISHSDRQQIVFVTPSDILTAKVLPTLLPLRGLHTIRIHYGAMKTCVGEPLNNVTFNILTSKNGYGKSQHKTKINIFNHQRQILEH